MISLLMSSAECALATWAGEQRQLRAEADGRIPTGRANPATHARGVLAEMAVARYLDVYYTPHLDPDHERGDVGNLEVRSSRRRHPELHLRLGRDERPGLPYVLVAVRESGRCELHGWEWSHAVITHGLNSHAWGVPTRYLPASQLQPIETLSAVFRRYQTTEGNRWSPATSPESSGRATSTASSA